MRSISIDGEGRCSPRASVAGQHREPCPDEEHSNLRRRSKFLMRLQTLGMTPGALDAWEKTHEQTEAAIIIWFLFVVAGTGLYAYLFVGAPAVGTYAYVFRVSAGLCTVNQGITGLGVWRYGQPYLDTLVYKLCAPLVTPSLMCLMIVGFVCPVESVPFGSTLHFTAVLALLVWTINCIIPLVPLVLPSEPCRRLVSVVFPSLMSTVRAVDGCTDLSFLRVLGQQVRSLHRNSDAEHALQADLLALA